MSTILLAEDDPDILHMVSYKLRGAGFDVVETVDGFAALRAALHRTPDLILLDVRMPRLDGLAVCRELRAGPRTNEVPIIMLTARARPQDREQAYAAGATDYIVKPFSPRHLVHRVEAVLARVGECPGAAGTNATPRRQGAARGAGGRGGRPATSGGSPTS